MVWILDWRSNYVCDKCVFIYINIYPKLSANYVIYTIDRFFAVVFRNIPHKGLDGVVLRKKCLSCQQLIEATAYRPPVRCRLYTQQWPDQSHSTYPMFQLNRQLPEGSPFRVSGAMNGYFSLFITSNSNAQPLCYMEKNKFNQGLRSSKMILSAEELRFKFSFRLLLIIRNITTVLQKIFSHFQEIQRIFKLFRDLWFHIDWNVSD